MLITPGRPLRIAGAVAVVCATGAAGGSPILAQSVSFGFLDPVEAGEEAPGREAVLPLYRSVTDSARLAELRGWTSNDAARRALALYEAALHARPGSIDEADQPPTLYIALDPGGNHAEIGFRLETADGVESHPKTAYVRLGPDDWRFGATLLHETGHVAFAVLSGGRRVARRDVATIPHSTAALTDRGTAFSEGYAIHLETWLAHTTDEPKLVVPRYRHDQFLFGERPGYVAEYYRPVNDFLTYAQSYSRYRDIRDNMFAFAPASGEGDYLRTQLDPTRDLRTLRTPNQLLQSEGFYASFFFSLVVRGATPPGPDVMEARERRVLDVLSEVLPANIDDPETPWLTRFVISYGDRYPDERAEVVDLLLDLSHGVFVDPEAAVRWREFYQAAIKLDLEGLNREGLEALRARWRTAVADDPRRLESRLGPQVRCEVADVEVRLIAFGEPLPLVFDANTVDDNVLRLVPGIDEAHIERWVAQRETRPYAGIHDLAARGLPEGPARSELRCTTSDPVPE